MKDFTELIETLPIAMCETSEEDCFIYRTDTTSFSGIPDIVIHPLAQNDIEIIVNYANGNNYSVVARGAGTGKSGGAVPLRGGILISFEKMDRIISIDRISKMAFVQPGVIASSLQKEVEKMGLYYPPDPSSNKTSTLGGNVAENAGGLHCVKYGITSRYVKGLKYIDHEGNLCKTGIYDDNNQNIFGMEFCGSEGTFGFITEIALELIDLPIVKKTFLIFHKSFVNAVFNIINIKKTTAEVSVLEIIDNSAITAVSSYIKLQMPNYTDTVVLTEIDGDSLFELEKKTEILKKTIIKSRAIDFESSEDKESIEKLWEIRRSISPAIRAISAHKLSEDIVIPLSQFPPFVKSIRILESKYGLKIPLYGHAGDGNLHVNILYDKKIPNSEQKALVVSEEIFKLAVELGGSITGEHGIGISKKNFLSLQYSKETIAFMKKIKKSYDNRNLINPGKIFNLKVNKK